MLNVGEKEVSSGTVSLRKRTGGDQGSMTLDQVLAEAQRLVDSRSLTL
jgi:threonyl-tRNA synthetase